MLPAADTAMPLAAWAVDVHGDGVASRYAAALLESLGAAPRACGGAADEHPALVWARSGLMALTGARDAPPRMLAAPLAACADGVVRALAALGARVPEAYADGAALLAERAALLGLQRNGATSSGGSCRLLRSADAMLAVNLARRDDWGLLPAWLVDSAVVDWGTLAQRLRRHGSAEVVERARLLGLPVAAATLPAPASEPWCRVQRHAPPLATDRGGRRPLVVDLSSLWAGPLCAQVLHQLGARVIKVESALRPDGARSDARAGADVFFDRLHAGKASVVLDFGNPAGLARLRRLLQRADIVIESARPRALRQLGIDAAQLLAGNPGLSWVALSGYGRDEPAAHWVAFGDDAGVAGGLSALLAASSASDGGADRDAWAFCGDAIADPLTGLHAALAAWSAWLGGGGVLVDIAMQRVVAHCASFELPSSAEALTERARRWTDTVRAAGLAERRPLAPQPLGRAREFGADTAAVLGELAA